MTEENCSAIRNSKIFQMWESNLNPRQTNAKSYILVTFAKSKDKEHTLLEKVLLTKERINLIPNCHTETGILWSNFYKVPPKEGSDSTILCHSNSVNTKTKKEDSKVQNLFVLFEEITQGSCCNQIKIKSEQRPQNSGRQRS